MAHRPRFICTSHDSSMWENISDWDAGAASITMSPRRGPTPLARVDNHLLRLGWCAYLGPEQNRNRIRVLDNCVDLSWTASWHVIVILLSLIIYQFENPLAQVFEGWKIEFFKISEDCGHACGWWWWKWWWWWVQIMTVVMMMAVMMMMLMLMLHDNTWWWNIPFYSVVSAGSRKEIKLKVAEPGLRPRIWVLARAKKATRRINKRQGKKEAPMQTAKRRFKQESRKPGYSQQQLEDKQRKTKDFCWHHPPHPLPPPQQGQWQASACLKMLPWWLLGGSWWLVDCS